MPFAPCICFIIMDILEVSLANLIETCRKNNLSMFINEDILKFVFFEIIKQLVILRKAGASHGDVKSDNVMFSYETDNTRVDLSAADVQLIDFGCSGPNGPELPMFRGFQEHEQNMNMNIIHVQNHVLEHDFSEHMFSHVLNMMFQIMFLNMIFWNMCSATFKNICF